MELDDALRQTVERALAGDAAAFEVLIRRFARLVYAQAFALLSVHDDCQDVVQETFVRAFTFRVRLRDPERFLPWLLSIARNLARDRIRDRCRRTRLADGTAACLAAPAECEPGVATERDEQWAEVAVALAGLPDRYRSALTMRYVEGRSHAQITADLGIPDGVLRGVLARGLARLRRVLRGGGTARGGSGGGKGGPDAT